MKDIEFIIDLYHEYKNAGKVYSKHKDEIKYELMNLALAEEKTMKVIKKHKK